MKSKKCLPSGQITPGAKRLIPAGLRWEYPRAPGDLVILEPPGFKVPFSYGPEIYDQNPETADISTEIAIFCRRSVGVVLHVSDRYSFLAISSAKFLGEPVLGWVMNAYLYVLPEVSVVEK